MIGHLGEALPFMLPRLNGTLPRETTQLDRSIGEYLGQNIYYTISGFNFIQIFSIYCFRLVRTELCSQRITPVDQWNQCESSWNSSRLAYSTKSVLRIRADFEQVDTICLVLNLIL